MTGKRSFWVFVIFLPFALALLTSGLRSLYFHVAENGGFVEWNKLPQAPDTIAKLLAVNLDNGIANVILYAEAINGKTYRAELYECFSSPESCWSEFSGGRVSQNPFFMSCARKFYTKDPPTTVVQRVDFCVDESDGHNATIQTNAVLLSDGSIWVWWHVIFNGDVFPLPWFRKLLDPPFLSFYVGIIISMVLLIWKKPWRWYSPSYLSNAN
jgi:hypothetical protein